MTADLGHNISLSPPRCYWTLVQYVGRKKEIESAGAADLMLSRAHRHLFPLYDFPWMANEQGLAALKRWLSDSERFSDPVGRIVQRRDIHRVEAYPHVVLSHIEPDKAVGLMRKMCVSMVIHL